MPEDHASLLEIARANNVLLEENNQMLKKMIRDARIAFWFKVALYALMLGLPFILFYYFLSPYLGLVSGSSSTQSTGGMVDLEQLQGVVDLYRGL